MVEQEKVTLNLSIVDLGKMDYLVEQGFYSNRSEFMRTAIRQQLKAHDPVVSDESLRGKMLSISTETPEVRSVWAIGVFKLDKALVIKHLASETKLGIFVVGALIVDRDITLEMIKEAVVSAKIYGSVSGQGDVVKFLKEGFEHD